MIELPKLNFPPCCPRLTECDGQTMVWDELRGRWLVLTPEEWVRRHTIAYLTNECGVMQHRVCQEYEVMLNGQRQRADVVVCGDRGEPLMLVECKEPAVELDSSVRNQAMRYNAVVGARYVILTNGVRLQGWERTPEGYRPLEQLPDLRAKQKTNEDGR